LLKSTRQHYHQRIAQVLAERFPDTAETQPELLAHHYTEAGRSTPAVTYWQQAGQRAVERSAYVEAISHLTNGLAVLKDAEDMQDRSRHELTLQITLALALHASRGQAAPEVEQAYARARELCEQAEDTPQLFRVLMGLYRFYGGRGQFWTAWDLVAHLLGLAQRTRDPELLLEAHMAQGTILEHLGELHAARSHLEQAMALYDVQRHRSHAAHYNLDPGIVSLSRLSWCLWLLGYPDQALRKSSEVLVMARELGHSHSLAMTLYQAAMFHQYRREAPAVQALAEATLTLATEQGFAQYIAGGAILRGWALTVQGQDDEGIAQL
jgi:tetratricopeptide (TPR) repeat protein